MYFTFSEVVSCTFTFTRCVLTMPYTSGYYKDIVNVRLVDHCFVTKFMYCLSYAGSEGIVVG